MTIGGLRFVVVTVLVSAVLSISVEPQSPRSPSAGRSPDGKPNFNGVWQVLNTAAWDIQDHIGRLGVPPGLSVVENNDIPYLPWAIEKKKQNYADRLTVDPDANCFLPGVPRVTYQPFPLQIVQTPKHVSMIYEYAHAQRVIPLDGSSHLEGALEYWMGDSRGRWEGDTLVVDVRNLKAETWFDRAGNFHSEALYVVERYSPDGADRIKYEVTIEDPKVFSRPWKMSMPLYRRVGNDARILEYECAVYLQDERFKSFTK